MPANIWQSVHARAETTLDGNRVITRSNLFIWYKLAVEAATMLAKQLDAIELAGVQREAIK